jgi:N-acetylglucosamine kinase-like BadF-type ATPase
MADRLLLGIDGGNTKTIGLVARADGTIVGAARSLRGSDIHAVPTDEAIEVIEGVAAAAIADADADLGAIAAAAFSLAGADWPEDIDLLERRLRVSHRDSVIVNDAIGALRATIPHGPGVVIVCGTGAATGARGPAGTTFHTSFWQEPQGARELGVRALRAVYRAELGIGPPTTLTTRILAATGEPDVESLLHHATARGVAGRRDPAAYAAILLDAADDGDAAAREIVRSQGVELAKTAIAAARRVGIEPDVPFGLAVTGGVVRHAGQALRDAIVESVRQRAPLVSVVTPTLEPAAGAVLLAFDAAGIEVDSGVEGQLRESLPPVDLFDTHPAATAASIASG